MRVGIYFGIAFLERQFRSVEILLSECNWNYFSIDTNESIIDVCIIDIS